MAVKSGRIKATGFNKLKTHPRVNGFIHAESDAVIKAAGCDTILVVRVSKHGHLRCSKPCDNCMDFLRINGVKRVFYIDWEGGVKEMRL